MTLGQADLDHVGPLKCGFFSIHTVSVFSLPCDFLNNVAFALACLIGRRHDRVHVINDPFPAALAPTTAWLCHLRLLGAEQSAPQPSGADPCFSNSVAAPGTIFSASLEGFALPAVSRLLWRMRAFPHPSHWGQHPHPMLGRLNATATGAGPLALSCPPGNRAALLIHRQFFLPRPPSGQACPSSCEGHPGARGTTQSLAYRMT